MPINLTPFALEPLLVEEKTYTELSKLKTNGWSETENELEFLVKLHYLRQGIADKKILYEDAIEREERLILNHWKKYL